jgi:hypothetical protein
MAMVRAALLALCSALGGGPIARPLPAMVRSASRHSSRSEGA